MKPGDTNSQSLSQYLVDRLYATVTDLEKGPIEWKSVLPKLQEATHNAAELIREMQNANISNALDAVSVPKKQVYSAMLDDAVAAVTDLKREVTQDAARRLHKALRDMTISVYRYVQNPDVWDVFYEAPWPEAMRKQLYDPFTITAKVEKTVKFAPVLSITRVPTRRQIRVFFVSEGQFTVVYRNRDIVVATRDRISTSKLPKSWLPVAPGAQGSVWFQQLKASPDEASELHNARVIDGGDMQMLSTIVIDRPVFFGDKTHFQMNAFSAGEVSVIWGVDTNNMDRLSLVVIDDPSEQRPLQIVVPNCVLFRLVTTSMGAFGFGGVITNQQDLLPSAAALNAYNINPSPLDKRYVAVDIAPFEFVSGGGAASDGPTSTKQVPVLFTYEDGEVHARPLNKLNALLIAHEAPVFNGQIEWDSLAVYGHWTSSQLLIMHKNRRLFIYDLKNPDHISTVGFAADVPDFFPRIIAPLPGDDGIAIHDTSFRSDMMLVASYAPAKIPQIAMST